MLPPCLSITAPRCVIELRFWELDGPLKHIVVFLKPLLNTSLLYCRAHYSAQQGHSHQGLLYP